MPDYYIDLPGRSRDGDNYSQTDIRCILENWQEVQGVSLRPAAIIRLADFDRAFQRLSPPLRGAVLVIGLAGLTIRESEEVLGCSYPTAWRRFQRGLEDLQTYINGRYQ